MIPASELREGYIIVLPDGSSQVIVSTPVDIIVAKLDNDQATFYTPNEMVTVEAAPDEF